MTNTETETRSIWIATTPSTSYPSLNRDIAVDTVVVGGGIAGISIAHMLKEKGQTVALIEKDRIVEGTTGNTTAKVTSLHGITYTKLLKRFGEPGAHLYGEANEAAISKIEEIIGRYDINCDFSRLSAYTYAQTQGDTEKVRQEAEAARRAGLPASFVENVPLPYETFGAVMFKNQAQFHVRKYLLALAEIINSEGSYIFEHTTAVSIRMGDDDTYNLITDEGVVSANDIVVATHKPFYDPKGTYEDLFEFRDYALGVYIKEPTPQGEFFSTGKEPHSVRYQPTDKGDVIIIGGKSEAEMAADTPEEAFRLTKEDYNNKFTITRVGYQWFTEDYATKDGVPYIGRLLGNDEHIYVATGFNGWGMTSGVLAGMILSDRITGRSNPWGDFFDTFTRESYRID